jgi:hypothetical protein
MNRHELPPEAGAGSDIERIKARIREQPFTRSNQWRWLRWPFVIGAACGLALGLWRIVDHVSNSAISLVGNGTFLFVDICLMILFCAIGSVCFSLAAYGCVIFFRPVYIALRYSPAEFEREYGSTVERTHKSL